MPYKRPNPLTVAHSVVFFQSFLLRNLPQEFVQEIGFEEARVALSQCLRPAVGSLEAASTMAFEAMSDFWMSEWEPAEYMREVTLHSMLAAKCLPDPARRDVLRAVVAIAVKAGSQINGDLEKFVRIGLPGLLGVKFADLSSYEDERALSAEHLNYPAVMVKLALANLPPR